MSIRLWTITHSDTILADIFVKSVSFPHFCQIRNPNWVEWVVQSALKKVTVHSVFQTHMLTQEMSETHKPAPGLQIHVKFENRCTCIRWLLLSAMYYILLKRLVIWFNDMLAYRGMDSELRICLVLGFSRKLIKHSDLLDFLNSILSIYIWLKSNNTIAGRGYMYFYFIVWKTFGLIGSSGLLNKSNHKFMFILPKQWLKPDQKFKAKY